MKPRPYRQVIRTESDRSQAVRMLESRNLEKPQVVSIAEYVPDHSGAQQRFYRVICRKLGDSLGYMPDEMAEEFKRMFMPAILWADPTKTTFHKIAREVEIVENRYGKEPAERLRKLFVMQMTTTDLNRKQMAEYITLCLDHAAEHGVVIETPEELRERAKTTTDKRKKNNEK